MCCAEFWSEQEWLASMLMWHAFIQTLCVCLHASGMSVFVWAHSWGMNRSAGQTNHINHERRSSYHLFVLCSDLFPMNLEKTTFIPCVYNASHKTHFLKFSENSYKFKFPAVTGMWFSQMRVDRGSSRIELKLFRIVQQRKYPSIVNITTWLAIYFFHGKSSLCTKLCMKTWSAVKRNFPFLCTTLCTNYFFP